MYSVTAPTSKFEEQLISTASDCDLFEGYPAGHSARVAEAADRLAEVFGMNENDRLLLQQAALIRNIGEVLMAREYISEPRQLTALERTDLQRHPVIGEQSAAKLELPRSVQLIVRWHHEWWNGMGYPDALSGDAIPLAARLLRVVDSYFALINERPFRNAMTEQMARRHLVDWAAIEFDPSVVKAFLEMPLAGHDLSSDSELI
ncbi:MAG: HD domain-containing protein [Acidobacteria bacterium]|nr:HD domain-containing protein [Acidobacteriota bacterium]